MKKNEKIIWVIIIICVGVFAYWYVKKILGVTIYNGYAASDIKGAVGGISILILLPIALIYELLKK